MFTARSDLWKFKGHCGNDAISDRIEPRHQGIHNFTYEIYHADSMEAAMRFLQRIPTGDIPGQYYVIVETAVGTWGKDCDGIYKED